MVKKGAGEVLIHKAILGGVCLWPDHFESSLRGRSIMRQLVVNVEKASGKRTGIAKRGGIGNWVRSWEIGIRSWGPGLSGRTP